MERGKIAVVIHTLNAELYLERVLRSVKGFEQIVICDMESTDATLAIAERYGCKILTHPPAGCAEPARNFAIQSADAEWVFVVDADELVPPALVAYLRAHIQKENPEEGVRIPRKNYFLGQWMHNDYPDYTCRFFRQDAVYWPPYVNTQPEIKGRVLTIPAARRDLAFIHLINPSVSLRLQKMDRYTDHEVERRKRERVSWFKLLFAPWFRFFKAYWMKGGFREGRAGYIHAKLQGMYKFATLAKLYEVQHTLSPDPELQAFSEESSSPTDTVR